MVTALAATQATNSTQYQSPLTQPGTPQKVKRPGTPQKVKSLAEMLAGTDKTMVICFPESGPIDPRRPFPVCFVPIRAAKRTILTTAEQIAVLTLTKWICQKKGASN